MKIMTPSQLFTHAAETEDFAVDAAKLAFTEEMLALMEAQGISRVALASKLDVAPSRITAMLRGLQNFTFGTAVRVARALNAEFIPKLYLSEKNISWIVVDDINIQIKYTTERCESSRRGRRCDDSKKMNESKNNEIPLAA